MTEERSPYRPCPFCDDDNPEYCTDGRRSTEEGRRDEARGVEHPYLKCTNPDCRGEYQLGSRY